MLILIEIQYMGVKLMRKNRGIIAGMSNGTIKKAIEAFSLRAFAEESNEGEGGTQTTPQTNFEDLIAKARKEEKEKQYKTIDKLKTQVSSLTDQHNDDLLRVADLEKQLKEANDKLTSAGSGDSEAVKTLKDTIKGLEQDKETLSKKVKEFEDKPPVSREEVEADVRRQLEAEYEVKTYRMTKMTELKDEILVPELVFGNTVEEIDASIQKALERSNEIRKNLGITAGNKPNKRTPKSPSNPSVSGVQDTEVSMEKLATMDVRSKEYAELRRQLGLR